jgi:transposase-like protein
MRINHREQFADRGNHISGIENFWNQAKRHLRRYNGIPRAQFPSTSRNANGASTTGPQTACSQP